MCGYIFNHHFFAWFYPRETCWKSVDVDFLILVIIVLCAALSILLIIFISLSLTLFCWYNNATLIDLWIKKLCTTAAAATATLLKWNYDYDDADNWQMWVGNKKRKWWGRRKLNWWWFSINSIPTILHNNKNWPLTYSHSAAASKE